MNKAVPVTVIAVAGVAAGAWFLVPRGPEAVLEEHWSMLDTYCTDCHNDIEYTADLSLEGRSPEEVAAEAAVWEKAIHKLNLGMMPPRDEPRPEEESVEEFVTALETTLDAAAAENPYAGKPPVHRLNRAEYENAIRDLLGVEADLASMLPSDGGDFGFDNIAEALTTSPMLLERYLTVALRVADMAIGNPDAVVTTSTYNIPIDLTQDYHLPELPLGTRGGVKVLHHFPADAEYVFSGRLFRGVEEGLYGIEGHDIPHEFLVYVDGEVVFRTEVGGEEDHQISLDEGINVADEVIHERMTSPPVPVTAGPHEVVFTWKERPASRPLTRQDAWEPAQRTSLEIHNPSGMPRLEMGEIQGPHDATGVSETPSREKIFVCRPGTAEAPACAEEILLKLARRAYRRPVTVADIESPLAFYREARESGGSFDAGIHAAVSRMLVSPSFLFRVESEASDVPAGSPYPISSFELATRLSFFLWSSIPDEELLDLAEQGRLREPEVLEAQVHRMIADSRSDALIENFTGQWLQLRNLGVRVKPDLHIFDEFDHNLRRAFRRETELLFANVLREGRPVHELLTADYTFVNERLARHYDIDDVYGTRFRQVELENPNRRGILGHGSLLSLTSASTHSSPILRGKFILTELMNNPPPAAPDDVPALEDSAPEGRPSTIREQLERHRADPVCSSCHDVIDPPGFALENFDAVGQWREETREGLPIDSSGILADGTEIDGPAALRDALTADPEMFANTVTRKLMIYALGRGLEPRDLPVVRGIVRNSAEDDYSIEAMILGIVDSFPFQMRVNSSESGDGQTIAQRGE